jgi:hypothetical protein
MFDLSLIQPLLLLAVIRAPPIRSQPPTIAPECRCLLSRIEKIDSNEGETHPSMKGIVRTW